MANHEIWKNVKGFEGYYQVSNLGNVKSLGRYKKNHGTYQYIPETMKSQRIDPQGYKMVDLYKNGKSKTIRIHRLVAEAFIDNKSNKKTVNHIDGNKKNNCVDNLEWATHREQNIHFYSNGLKSKENIRTAVKQMNKAQAKPLIDVVSGIFYTSISDCARRIHISPKKIKSLKTRFVFI